MADLRRWLLRVWLVAGLVGLSTTGADATGAPPAPAPNRAQAVTRIWTDKPQYSLGETLRYCYSVSRPGLVRITDTTADGRSQVVVSGNDDGRGDCRTGTITPPTGTERLHLDLLVNNRVLESADTSFTVVGNAATPSSPGGSPAGSQAATVPTGGIFSSQIPVAPQPPSPQVGSPPPSLPPAPALSVQLWTDKAQYSIGDTITYCYSLSAPADVVVTNFTPDGSSQVVYSGYDDRGGSCGSGTITPPTGAERIRVEASVNGVLQATAETSFEVTG